jgi:hypothetical protein
LIADGVLWGKSRRTPLHLYILLGTHRHSEMCVFVFKFFCFLCYFLQISDGIVVHTFRYSQTSCLYEHLYRIFQRRKLIFHGFCRMINYEKILLILRKRNKKRRRNENGLYIFYSILWTLSYEWSFEICEKGRNSRYVAKENNFPFVNEISKASFSTKASANGRM